jgi:hypothetical protein
MPAPLVVGGIALAAGFFAKPLVLDPIQNLLGFAGNDLHPTIPFHESQLFDAYINGTLELKAFREAGTIYGLKIGELALGNLEPINLGADGVFRRNYNANPNDYDIMSHYLRSSLYHPTNDEILVLLNRGIIDNTLATYYFTLNGMKGPYIQKMIESLRYEIPGISDIIRFSVREAFTPELVKAFGYNNEFPEAVAKWAAKQGFGGTTDVIAPPGFDANGQPVPAHPATWAELYWWSHWELPSLTQGYEMFHRNYSVSRFGPSPNIHRENGTLAQELIFEQPHLENLQKAQDIPTYWRKLLQSVSYLPLTRVDVRRMYDVGVMDKAGIYHAYRAIGYNDTNALNLTNFTVKLKEDRESKKKGSLSKDKICSLYTKGIIRKEEARQLWNDMGIVGPEIDNTLTACELTIKSLKVTEGIKYIKRGYMTGNYTLAEVREALNRLGILEFRIKDYIELWELQLRFGKTELNAGKTQSLYQQGIIDRSEAIRRLKNLGIIDSSINHLLTEAEAAMLRTQQKAQEKQARVVKSAAKEATAEIEKLRKQSLASSTIGNLRDWIMGGLITEFEARARLAKMFYSYDDQTRFITAALQKAAKQNKSKPQPVEDE